MADFLITRRGGGAGEPTPPPSINFVSATFDSITFTITNNSVSGRDISYGLTTPPTDESFLLAGLTTSDPLTITGLDSETAYAIYAQAEDSVITQNIFTTLTQPLAATGGTITEDNNYRYHTFSSTGASIFSVSSVGDGLIDILVVGGGGSGCGGIGGVVWGAGGGGGRVMLNQNINISQQNYTITVAAGANSVPGTDDQGLTGGTSSAFGINALGGQGGSGTTNGGGRGGISGSGNSGGVRNGLASGGGAGDQQNGFNAPTSNTGGNGGSGRNVSTIFPYWGTNSSNGLTSTRGFFGGGGGGNNGGGSGTAFGGAGGGATLVQANGTAGAPGMINTGGGGSERNAGSGGSGIVIIRYPLVDTN